MLFIYYSMDKYSGCNIVDTVVSESTGAVKVKKRVGRGLVIKLVTAAVVIGFFALIRFAPGEVFSTMREALRCVFCYDFFGRTEFGGMPLFG